MKDGGLMCVTCTDMPVLSGVYPETCFAKVIIVPNTNRVATDYYVCSTASCLSKEAIIVRWH